MIRLEIIRVDAGIAFSNLDFYARQREEELAKVEDFIHGIGCENIKNIIVSSPYPGISSYSIFYEDGMPFSSRLDNLPPQKKFFGK